MYPFQSRYIDLNVGKLHYVDEGEGEILLMVHGNPSWSFGYRHLIQKLSVKYRCIAPDHIGFGLSDKPFSWSYIPSDHAKNLQTFIDRLELEDITLIVQDWGGPIGLFYAVEHPENIKRLVIMNTWMWPVSNDPYYWGFSKFIGGPIGRYLIRNQNFFADQMVKMVTGDKSKLTPGIHDHYRKPFPTRESRKSTGVFPGQITASKTWLADLWSKRNRLTEKPTLIAWGMKDIAFREKELNRWVELFPTAEVHRFQDSGHFVQEEQGEEVSRLIEVFIQNA
jgi:haloalkane dehalogenase